MSLSKTRHTFVAVGLMAALWANVATASNGRYTVELNSMNNSGVAGTATLTLRNSNELTVIVSAQGLEAERAPEPDLHSLGGDQNSTCPTLPNDNNGDNLLEGTDENGPVYGAAVLPLSVSATSNENGNFVLTQTFTLGQGETISGDELAPLENRVLVLHGLTVPGRGYVPRLPIACGQIESQGNGDQG